ncbi:DUF1616 domain-containing protein [Halobaculum lipolyticum]|uniref:DUF1616 domain-containing protein n=1 Tax=Halobaculum lipolyticum TaxID=3032001 RepID=A0ABD5WE48_9EURY|nr:DUF1616 domain-containing protein [Halobaculum sp. DT31]
MSGTDGADPPDDRDGSEGDGDADARGDGGPFDRLPVDVAVVVGGAVLVGALVVGGVVGGALRVVLAVPLVVFLPGYALLSVLFPAAPPADADRPSVWRLPTADGLGWVERCSLAVPASLAVVVFSVVGLGAVGLTPTTVAVVGTLVAVVAVASAAGAVRRDRLPPGVAYDVPAERWGAELRTRWGGDGGRSRLDRGLDVAVAVAVLLAVSGLAVGLAAPDNGESYTEAALLTEGPNGPVAGDYPENLTAGESTELLLTVANRLGTDATYDVVVVLDRVRGTNTTGSVTVLERSELSRFTLGVGDGREARRPLAVTPDLLGDDLRLSVFVYRGEAPASPSAATADEHLYLWVDVR